MRALGLEVGKFWRQHPARVTLSSILALLFSRDTKPGQRSLTNLATFLGGAVRFARLWTRSLCSHMGVVTTEEVGPKEKIRPLNHVWTCPIAVYTRIFKTMQKCSYFHKTLLFQEGTLYFCLLTGPPVNVRADLKIKVVFVWKIWTRSLFFVFSVQSSLENSGSTAKLKMCAYMHTHTQN